MPPKLKLSKSKGKCELVLNKNTASSSGTSAPQITESAELQEQFEVELCWCIQKLQTALSSGKLNQKQVQENSKILNSLMSNSTPFIKKRQVMRMTFGDYRAKMAEENKKTAIKGLNLKITPTSPSKKSKFVKKSQGNENFKFNFNIENLNIEENNTITEEISKETSMKDFHFTPSSNGFRFNFSSEAE